MAGTVWSIPIGACCARDAASFCISFRRIVPGIPTCTSSVTEEARLFSAGTSRPDVHCSYSRNSLARPGKLGPIRESRETQLKGPRHRVLGLSPGIWNEK
jgi:hypothetical protein